MTTMISGERLVQELPIRLRNFFARYPPQLYSARVRPQPTPPVASASPASSTSSPEQSLPSPYTPDRDSKGAHKSDPEKFSAARALLYSDPKYPNPFLPKKAFKTGKWISPRFGLRQQADLVKLAKKYNVEVLLPPGPKSTEYKEAKRMERGLRIKGTGIGQKVKGHKWERTMEAKLEDRRKAMVDMPEMIRSWKQVSHFQNMAPTLQRLILSCSVVMAGAGNSGQNDKEASASWLFLFISRRVPFWYFP